MTPGTTRIGFKSIENKIDNDPCEIMIASGDYTCTVVLDGIGKVSNAPDIWIEIDAEAPGGAAATARQ
jgi:hypothetical protein